MKCVACGNQNWLSLPDPHPSRSITTSGMMVAEPLGKSHCANCGLVQRTRAKFLGLTDFDEKNSRFTTTGPARRDLIKRATDRSLIGSLKLFHSSRSAFWK